MTKLEETFPVSNRRLMLVAKFCRQGSYVTMASEDIPTAEVSIFVHFCEVNPVLFKRN